MQKDFLSTIKRLEDKIIKLESTIQTLVIENQALRRENAVLCERVGLNSSNSSIPSSRDLYKLPKPKKSSESKIGGQPGHKGSYREMLPADEVIEVELPKICECGGKLSLSLEPYIHRRVDLPEIKPYVVEYHLRHGRCCKCGKRRTSQLPQEAGRDVFGPRVKAAISAFGGFYKNSKSEIANIFKDIFNLNISTGSISNSEAKVSNKCRDIYQDIEGQVNNSKVVHIDETSHYRSGKLGWGWMFTSQEASLLKLTESRGKKVLEDSPFGESDSIYVTDRYAAYNYFTKENRQVCWAHLHRDFKRFAHSQNLRVSELGTYLEKQASELFAIKKSLDREHITVLQFLRRAKKIRKRTWHYLKNITCTEDAVHASRVAKNIMKVEDMMWKFLDNPLEIPLTNNHAERQIRHYVVYRKNSYHTWSARGNRFLERIISIYLTAKQQKQNPYQNLLQIIA
jgi:transposase